MSSLLYESYSDDNKKAFCYIYGGVNYKYFIFDVTTNGIVGQTHQFTKKEMAEKSVFLLIIFMRQKKY